MPETICSGCSLSNHDRLIALRAKLGEFQDASTIKETLGSKRYAAIAAIVSIGRKRRGFLTHNAAMRRAVPLDAIAEAP